MYIEKINLEITRRCSLECEHCFRGENQSLNINKATLNNIFNNVKKIDKLIITGGEPLIAVNELEELIKLINKNNIQIEQINIVTNGTILSSRILKILKDLSNLSNLQISISYDIFHLIELEKKNLKQKSEDNVKILKELFNAKEYGNDNYENSDIKPDFIGIQPIGRAKNLTQERLDEINSKHIIKYDFMPFITWTGTDTKIEGNIVSGDISIDVNGNIVKYGLSFEEEDNFSNYANSNVNSMSLEDAIKNYINIINPKNINIK